jgi:hypothetical protein
LRDMKMAVITRLYAVVGSSHTNIPDESVNHVQGRSGRF